MEQFIIDWGYWAVALGCFFEGETVLVLGGVLAHKGLLRLHWVMLAACVGSVSGDQLWFLLGRYTGSSWVGRMRRLQDSTERLKRWMIRHGNWFAFGFRFLYGIRTVAPAFLGISGFQFSRFATLNIVGAAVWSVVVGSLGWSMGLAVERLLGRAARIEEALLGVVILGGAVWFTRRMWRGTQSRKTAAVVRSTRDS